MATMKKFLNIVVVVITCFCILMTTCIPASATTFISEETDEQFIYLLDSKNNIVESIPVDDFDFYDYAVDYQDYLYLKNNVNTLNAAGGVLGFEGGLAWSSVFAELGKVCSTGGMYFLGILAVSGALVYSANGIYDVLVNEGEEAFYDLISLIWLNSDEATRAMLEDMFDLYVAGESVTISSELSQQIAYILNDKLMTDSAGNVINPSLSVSDVVLGGVFADTFASSLKVKVGEELLTMSSSKTVGVLHSSSAFDLTWNSYLKTDASDTNKYIYLKLTNDITGAWIDLSQTVYSQFRGYSGNLSVLSKFYQVIPSVGLPYWITYAGHGSFSSSKTLTAMNPLSCSPTYPITFGNTGTVLDGKTIVDITLNDDLISWNYTDSLGNILVFPIDPIGLILSNTGTGVSNTTVIPNGDDKVIDIPYIPPVSLPSDGTIGIPITNTLLQDVTITTDTVIDNTLPSDPDIKIDTPDGIKTFLGGISDYFKGIFDWLPDDFRDKLDGVLLTLQGIVVLMVAVKIVDIIWP